MKKEKYSDIYLELTEIAHLRKEYDFKYINFSTFVSTSIHFFVFYLISLISLNALIISSLAYISSLVITYATRQDAFAKRHEVHAVTIHEEIIRLQELVQENLVNSEDARDLTPSVYS